jgi:hypothetical protein
MKIMNVKHTCYVCCVDKHDSQGAYQKVGPPNNPSLHMIRWICNSCLSPSFMPKS